MRVRATAWLFVVGLCAACSPPLRDVRVRASAMLHCADADVQLRRAGSLDYAARGCGHALVVRCVNDDAATCHALAAAPARALDRARAPAAAHPMQAGYARSSTLSVALAPLAP